MFNGQILQDKFVLNILNKKKNGYFLEIGSGDPIEINNSYVLETSFNWKGIMIEHNETILEKYKLYRPNSIHVISDASTVNYYDLLQKHNAPKNIDYLQIDLEVNNRSTLTTLENLNNTIFDEYTFAVITFEHDIYIGDHFNTRLLSREIFLNRGYVLVFADVRNGGCPFEDWYVHPSLVNMDYINTIKSSNSLEFREIMTRLY